MKKILILTIIFAFNLYSQDDFGTVRVNELYFGNSFGSYDVKVYRSAANEVTVDNNTIIAGDLTVAKIINSNTIDVRPGNNSALAIGYNSTGVDIIKYNGTTPVFTVQVNGDVTIPGEVYGVSWNGSNEAAAKNDIYDKIQSMSSNIDWNNLINVPERIINYAGSNLQLRSNVIEENTTAGEAQLWVNWSGYNSGTSYYRDFVIGDGKNNTVAYFDGNTKEVDFNGNLDLNGNDLTVDDIFTDQVNAIRIVSSPGASVDIRPASGQALAVGYNAGGAVDFIHYGGGTSPVFSVQENGAATFAGDVTIPADVYGAGWNGLQEAAPKDAVYDAIEGLTAGGIADGDKGDITVSGTGAIWNIDNGALAFSEISSKPTTLSGYGITDAASSSHSHSFGSLSAIPSTFTPSIHGNGSHSESYITASALNGYATNSYVDAQINNLQNWVISQNYATQSWVSSQGYASTAQVSYIQGLVIALESRVTSCGCP